MRVRVIGRMRMRMRCATCRLARPASAAFKSSSLFCFVRFRAKKLLVIAAAILRPASSRASHGGVQTKEW